MAVAEFSTVVESDLPLVVDRTMTWDGSGYGSHSETSLAAPALRWYLAEGSTKGSFDLYYLLQNPSLTDDAEVKVTYLLPGGRDPIVEQHTVPANGRYNIHVDDRPGLGDTDVSAVFEVTNGVPVLVERAMYVNDHGRLFDSGHDAAAVTAPAASWFLAEGATHGLFDTFILLSNPNPSPVTARVTYLLEDGRTFTRDAPLPASSRDTIWVNYETVPCPGVGLPDGERGLLDRGRVARSVAADHRRTLDVVAARRAGSKATTRPGPLRPGPRGCWPTVKREGRGTSRRGC